MGKICAFFGDPLYSFSNRRRFDLEEFIGTLFNAFEMDIFMVGNETIFDKEVFMAAQKARKTYEYKFRLCLVLAKHFENEPASKYEDLGYDFVFVPEQIAQMADKTPEERLTARNIWMADKADMLITCDYIANPPLREAVDYADAQKKLVITMDTRSCF